LEKCEIVGCTNNSAGTRSNTLYFLVCCLVIQAHCDGTIYDQACRGVKGDMFLGELSTENQ